MWLVYRRGDGNAFLNHSVGKVPKIGCSPPLGGVCVSIDREGGEVVNHQPAGAFEEQLQDKFVIGLLVDLKIPIFGR